MGIEFVGLFGTFKYLFAIVLLAVFVSVAIGSAALFFLSPSKRYRNFFIFLCLILMGAGFLISAFPADTRGEFLGKHRDITSPTVIILVTVLSGISIWYEGFRSENPSQQRIANWVLAMAFFCGVFGGMMGSMMGSLTGSESSFQSVSGALFPSVAGGYLFFRRQEIFSGVKKVIDNREIENLPIGAGEILSFAPIAAFLFSGFIVFLDASNWSKSARLTDICVEIYKQQIDGEQNDSDLVKVYKDVALLRLHPPATRRDALFWKACVDNFWQYGTRYPRPPGEDEQPEKEVQ